MPRVDQHRRGGLAALIAVGVASLLVPTTSFATYPGADGRIAFALQRSMSSYEADLATVQPDGTELQRLTTLPGKVEKPSWSPDGSKITFTHEHEQNTWLYVVAADGSDPMPLVRVGGYATGSRASPSFSADGDRIAYSTGDAIRTIRTDGTDPRVLVKAPKREDGTHCCVSYPVYSPKGNRVAFVREGRALKSYGIWTAKSDGTKLRHILSTRKPKPFWQLDYRPDGREIVFLYASRGAHTISSNGSDRQRFRPFPQQNYSTSRPTYAPSGQFVVATAYQFSGGLDERCGDLLRVAVDGSEPQAITTNCSGYLGPSSTDPAWQPLLG
jgi:Tol biopolymer transport system component